MENLKDKGEDYWKEKLTPEQYDILRNKGTEAPGSGQYDEFDQTGMFVCAACGAELFSSKDKFHSGTGWPSFCNIAGKNAVDLEDDNKFLMKRTEVLCKQCGGHLGHVFNDGPKPTGLRYCINSGALSFKHSDKKINKK